MRGRARSFTGWDSLTDAFGPLSNGGCDEGKAVAIGRENSLGRLGAGEKRTTRKRQGLTVHGIRKRLHVQWLQ
ncbi:hypothetical protein CBM2634_U120010 [Cupriavidus taiwanensis]|uniref:Uncharacterized protein n=1 Tax=Cupriavidus taiwanensis TaxID=164546 RepID=A0A375JBM6_9BURK|nr:hypothetical protein CBM2634_U120010 [Cupriavidus taiwanensis]